MKIDDKAPEAAAAAASSADYTAAAENGQPKRACKTLTPEQRAQIVELTEERARDALPDYFYHKSKAPKKPAGEPPNITEEQRAAIFTYYKDGGEKPDLADRFSYDADKGKFIDLERKQWIDNGGREYINEQWALHDELGQIRDRIIDEALEPFDLYNPDYSIPTENIPLYSEIVATVAEVLSRVIDELEAAGLESQTSALQPYSKLARPIMKSGLMDDRAVTVILREDPTEGNFRLMSMLNEGSERTFKYAYMINQTAEGKKEQVLVKFFADRKLEPDDIPLTNAIGTFLHSWIKEGNQLPCLISPIGLWRVKEGFQPDDTTQRPPRGEVEAICDRLDRLIDTWFYLEYAQERAAGRFRKGSKHAASNGSEGHFLMAKKDICLSSKGKIISAYKFLEVPELYSYCTDKRTVTLIPYTDMRITASNWKSDYRSLAKEYFLRQIHLMNEGKRKSHKILYKTFYSESGVPSPEERAQRRIYKNSDGLKTAIRKNAARDRKHLHDMLNSMKDNGTISDWRETRAKSGSSFDGIEITLNPDRAVKSKSKEA